MALEGEASNRDEGIRQLIELAISSGRTRQSTQTGYIHICHHIQDEEEHLPIPVFENLLFALALLRTRISENILEAKEIIGKLLYFQNQITEAKGNFPIYLHEFPFCGDRFAGVHLLAPLYWMLKDYSQIMGSELKQRLETSLRGLMNYCLRIHEEKAASYPIAIKIGAAAKALGIFLAQSDWLQKGEFLLNSLQNEPENKAWYNPASMADMLVALQMVHPSLLHSPWKPFWIHLQNTWHSSARCYAGPALKDFQLREEAQPTLYDLFMGYFSKAHSYRAFADHPFHLQGALIQPSQDRLEPLSYPFTQEGNIEGRSWIVRQEQKYAFSAVSKNVSENLSLMKGFQPVRLVWGNRTRMHSLVCQGGSFSSFDFKPLDHGIELVFTLNECPEEDDGEKNREMAFYFDAQEGVRTLVNGLAANTFRLDEKVSILDELCPFSLTFSLIEGEGQFLGHFTPGNRPSQIALKGKDRFNAYDWQIFLRTIRRLAPCKIRVLIEIHPL